MHLKRHQAVQYMKDVEFPMSERTWYRWKTKLNNEKRQRLFEIVRIGYEEEHTDSIEEIETARKLLWKEYNEAKGLARATILEKIINTRPLLSSYYDATKEVVEKPNADIQKDTDIQESTTEQQPNEWV